MGRLLRMGEWRSSDGAVSGLTSLFISLRQGLVFGDVFVV
jgi:hypothetical protein